jgi:hypothetical protein
MPLILDEIHWDAHSFLVFFSAAMIFFIYLMRQLKVEETQKPLDALDLPSENAQAFAEGNGKPIQETTLHRDPIRQPH